MATTYQWYLGIDWGSEAHQLCLVDRDGQVRGELRVRHAASDVEVALRWIRDQIGLLTPTAIAAAIERPRGALIDAVLEQEWAVFSVNPLQVDRFRDRHTVAGAKDDRRDAFVLADSLRTDPQAFRRIQAEDPLIVQLREWARMESELDRELRALTNRLREQAYRLAPALVELCPAADEPWLWALLERAPTPPSQRALSSRRLAKLLRDHLVRRLTADQLHQTLQTQSFPLASGVIEASAAHIAILLPQLRLLSQQRKTCVRHTEQLLQTLRERPEADEQPGEQRDIALLESLPGVGRKTTIALLTDAGQPLAARAYHTLRTRLGLAPVTKASGKRRLVSMRYACHHGLRQAAYHWGRVAVQRDPASKAYYATLRARGHTHGRALRSVVDRLLRILMAMLQTRSLYDPNRFATSKAA